MGKIKTMRWKTMGKKFRSPIDELATAAASDRISAREGAAKDRAAVYKKGFVKVVQEKDNIKG